MLPLETTRTCETTPRCSRLALLLAVTILAGCAAEQATSPTVPDVQRRAVTYGCVGPAYPDVPPDTVAVDAEGGCQPGFDHIIWY